MCRPGLLTTYGVATDETARVKCASDAVPPVSGIILSHIQLSIRTISSYVLRFECSDVMCVRCNDKKSLVNELLEKLKKLINFFAVKTLFLVYIIRSECIPSVH